MEITTKDEGRKVRLRNGNVDKIKLVFENADDGDAILLTHSKDRFGGSIFLCPDGSHFGDGLRNDFDIVGFIEEEK